MVLRRNYKTFINVPFKMYLKTLLKLRDPQYVNMGVLLSNLIAPPFKLIQTPSEVSDVVTERTTPNRLSALSEILAVMTLVLVVL